MEIARKIFRITESLEIPFIFKASYKKANRSRVDSFSGIGDKKALEVIRKVGENLSIPTLTDIHTEEEAVRLRCMLMSFQIPAFLFLQETQLLIAPGKPKR